MHTDAHGRAYIMSADGTSEWCQDHFENTVVRLQDDSQGVYIMLPSGDAMTLVDFQQRHEALQIPVPLPARAIPVKITIFLLKQSVSGVWLLWSMSSWYQTCLGDSATCTCSRWYQNWWPWWGKLLVSFGLDASHLRKPVANSSKGDADPLRFLAEPTMSTTAMVILLSRWSSESKSSKDKNEPAKLAWQACLQGVLRFAFDETRSVNFAVYLDLAVSVRPGLPMVGVNQVRLPVRGCLIDLRPVLECDEPAVLQSLQAVGKIHMPSQVHLFELCVMMDSAGRKVQWLWKQFVHNITCVIDSTVLQLAETVHGPTSDNVEETDTDIPAEDLLIGRIAAQRQRRLAKHKLKLSPLISTVSARRILQYFLSSRKHFQKQQCLHVAFDASRVGGLSRMLGFISRPDGFGAWMAPQAIKQTELPQQSALIVSSIGI